MQTHAVRADHADAGFAQLAQHLGLEVGALGAAGFAEAGREQVDDLDAFGDGIVDQSQDCGGGNGRDQGLHGTGHVGQGLVERSAVGQLATARIEAVHLRYAVEVADTAQEHLPAAPTGRARRDAGDGDSVGSERGAQRGLRVGPAIGI